MPTESEAEKRVDAAIKRLLRGEPNYDDVHESVGEELADD